jgi:hypothetical protein
MQVKFFLCLIINHAMKAVREWKYSSTHSSHCIEKSGYCCAPKFVGPVPIEQVTRLVSDLVKTLWGRSNLLHNYVITQTT